ncbi:hypothetical protein QR680_001192 [Steinernema hermaphroditum]|uniref:Uncharacterized protein n=1 Tax=Steinernema hermaphroditum TaxID=289476 RepID=A0AA39GYV8_9BILA|nr:hypothetical protein QR680_001192 [Steinernema hermaphroditum]
MDSVGDTPDAEPEKPILKTSDASSMLGLRSELLKKSSLAKAGSSSSRVSEVNLTQSSILRGPKKAADRVKIEKGERLQALQKSREISAKQIEMDEKRRKILEEKSRVYERMSRGEVLVNDDGREAEFLVNFLEKRDELEEASERRRKHEDADSDEDRERSATPPLIEHYVPNEERRVYGASHVVFSNNEEARQKEISALLALSTQTAASRDKVKKQAKEVEEKVDERLKELRNQFELPEPEPEPEPVEPEVPLDSISLPSDEPPEKRPKRSYGIREWDIGKEQQFRYMESRREERDDEFRPPTSYYRH